MEHVVFFPAPDDSPAFRRVADLEEAVRLVEHLRNVEGISSVSVHALTEVPLAFRAYYKVEVPVGALVQAQPVVEPPPVDLDPVPLAVEPAAEPFTAIHGVPPLALVEDEPAEQPVLVSSNGHAKEGPASLGFFA
ncbi:MAG: hypothetical protein WD794_14600 [Mycobacteriales bacterium]